LSLKGESPVVVNSWLEDQLREQFQYDRSSVEQ